MQESRFPRNDDEKELSLDELQHARQSEYEDTCELSQCRWLPTSSWLFGTYEKPDRFEAQRNQLETCFLAELRAKYVEALKDYCNNDEILRVDKVHCDTLDSRLDASNPGNKIPEFCYAPANTPPNQPSPEVNDPESCNNNPYIMTYDEVIREAENLDPNNFLKGLLKYYTNAGFKSKDIYNKPACPSYSSAFQDTAFNVGTDACYSNSCNYLSLNKDLNPFATDDWYQKPVKFVENFVLKHQNLRECDQKTNNFGNMSNIYFRWPLAMGTCLHGPNENEEHTQVDFTATYATGLLMPN